jgi:hypothetical protein
LSSYSERVFAPYAGGLSLNHSPILFVVAAYVSSAPTLILPFFPGFSIPLAIYSPVDGYQFSCQSLRFFGGLHDADIAEILGVDTPVVCRN